MSTSTAHSDARGEVLRVLLGAGVALAIIGVAVVITVIGDAHEPGTARPISATEPSRGGQSPRARSSDPSPAPGPTTTAVAASSVATLPFTDAPTAPSTSAPAAPAEPTPAPTTTQPAGPTVTLTGPSEVTEGGEFQWHSHVTGAVSGTWSGTVLDGEKGTSTTSPWSYPSGVFVWDHPSARLESGSYTITLTVSDASGRSAQATVVVAYPAP